MSLEGSGYQLDEQTYQFIKNNKRLIEILFFYTNPLSKNLTYEEISERLTREGESTITLLKELDRGIQLQMIGCLEGNELKQNKYFLKEELSYKAFVRKEEAEAKEKKTT